MSHRFFVEEEPRDVATLTGEQAHQIANVLRLRAGDRITLVRDGVEATTALERVSAREVRGRVLERRPVETESRSRLALAIPMLRGEHTDQVIAAVTQLGVSEIVPFVSVRSVVRELSPAKRERWQRIARESAETARRGRVPAVREALPWSELVGFLEPPIVVAWEAESERRLRDVVSREGLSLVVGPEGGLDASEIALAREHAAITVSLGRRNLRSETAAIAAVAQVMSGLE